MCGNAGGDCEESCRDPRAARAEHGAAFARGVAARPCGSLRPGRRWLKVDRCWLKMTWSRQQLMKLREVD
eukprot:315329-Rhodomonas_salina.4